MADIDASEVAAFARDLTAIAPATLAHANVAVRREANRVAREARAAAPKDRPWLSTAEGIRVRFAMTGGTAFAQIESPLDPDKQSVGYRVEYGTSVMAPQPFLTPAFQAAKARLISDLVKHVSKPL